ncbi:tetratricopeptide repeat protein [Streptomyces sp. BE303]|uniref:tetratricopeptide repeat protein n=1 Tax=Streptomyces sp. BE303 TaxID=3002528 RepID=UPI002E771D41|nr:tetratricopeptide repeat protein [Streptomyces sp. BE303]MED7947406.1 tetratricopeptide repeat protein [Streptomyces sp. BE303]
MPKQRHEAHDAHQNALAAYQDLGDQDGGGIAWNNIGTARRRLGDYERAVEAGERAVTIFRELDDLHRLGEATNELADTLLAA